MAAEHECNRTISNEFLRVAVILVFLKILIEGPSPNMGKVYICGRLRTPTMSDYWHRDYIRNPYYFIRPLPQTPELKTGYIQNLKYLV